MAVANRQGRQGSAQETDIRILAGLPHAAGSGGLLEPTATDSDRLLASFGGKRKLAFFPKPSAFFKETDADGEETLVQPIYNVWKFKENAT